MTETESRRFPAERTSQTGGQHQEGEVSILPANGLRCFRRPQHTSRRDRRASNSIGVTRGNALDKPDEETPLDRDKDEAGLHSIS